MGSINGVHEGSLPRNDAFIHHGADKACKFLGARNSSYERPIWLFIRFDL